MATGVSVADVSKATAAWRQPETIGRYRECAWS